MARKDMFTKELVQARGEVLRASKDRGGRLSRGRVVQDRTFLDMTAFDREYKLARAYTDLRNLEFRSREVVKLQTFKEYARHRFGKLGRKLAVEEVPRPDFPADEAYLETHTSAHYARGSMLVLVDSDVHAAIAGRLDRYVIDLAYDGWWATVYVVDGGSASQIRSFLHSKGVVGALLVGDITAPWFEHDGSQFPCDLYYMDSQGAWTDPDGDGRFDEHTGDVQPEIWVSRLITPTMDGNDADLLNDYFDRNHAYRTGKLGHARSALAYVDNDWQGFGSCALDDVLPASTITTYTDPETTDGDLYKAEVNELRSWVQVCVHSWVKGHSFEVTGPNEFVDSAYFRDVNPPNAHFYNLFACGPGKYTEEDYLAGWYLFDKSGGGTNHSMALVASAKSGSMLFFEDFYTPMASGMAIGPAYLDWWQARPLTDDWERKWFYGLALMGDPTLNWWNGAVPQPIQPQAEDTFDHWPRNTQLRWQPVDIPGVTYTVEVDAIWAVNGTGWAAETNQTFLTYNGLTETKLDHTFVGAQRGRWRVRAKIDGVECAWSPWSYFRYTF